MALFLQRGWLVLFLRSMATLLALPLMVSSPDPMRRTSKDIRIFYPFLTRTPSVDTQTFAN
jgi:hypothetical protein